MVSSTPISGLLQFIHCTASPLWVALTSPDSNSNSTFTSTTFYHLSSPSQFAPPCPRHIALPSNMDIKPEPDLERNHLVENGIAAGEFQSPSHRSRRGSSVATMVDMVSRIGRKQMRALLTFFSAPSRPKHAPCQCARPEQPHGPSHTSGHEQCSGHPRRWRCGDGRWSRTTAPDWRGETGTAQPHLDPGHSKAFRAPYRRYLVVTPQDHFDWGSIRRQVLGH